MNRVVAHVLPRHVELSQTFVREEIAELRRQGVRVVTVALLPGDAPDHDKGALYVREAFAGRWASLPAHLARLRRHPLRYLRFLGVYRALRDEDAAWSRLPAAAAELEARGVQRLHAHFAWESSAAACGLAALTGIPWSMTMHARDIFHNPMHLPYKLASADRLVTVCEYNRRWLEATYAPTKAVAIVICGVEVPPPVQVAPTIEVVAVGRLVAKKGFDVLVEAAALLAPLRPGLSVEIVGAGPENEALCARIKHLGLEGIVKLTGALPHAATLARIAAARVLCLPARIDREGDRDSMPVVIKEAMARARPVVATDAVGIPEMIDDSCGRLVAPDDPVALADALAEVLANDELAASLGRAGRARVLERFTIGGEVAKLRRLLDLDSVPCPFSG